MKYFKGADLARMSDGSYCIVRDLGLVKGGRGLRHFECLLRFGLLSKLVQIFWHQAKSSENSRLSEIPHARVSGPLERESADEFRFT